MKKVNIHEAKTMLSKLIQDALAGEDVVIAKGGKPLVRLVIIEQEIHARSIGNLQGKVSIADDFDDIPSDFSSYVS
jgi:antitoxin (DNA-binding transcriptional repressor) of toxin-antitoxin stability system